MAYSPEKEATLEAARVKREAELIKKGARRVRPATGEQSLSFEKLEQREWENIKGEDRIEVNKQKDLERLTGPEFIKEWRNLRDDFLRNQRELSLLHRTKESSVFYKNELYELIKEAQGDDEVVKVKIDGIIKNIQGLENELTPARADGGRAFLHAANEFAKKYGLEIHFNEFNGVTALGDLRKEYNARMFEVGGRMDDIPEDMI